MFHKKVSQKIHLYVVFEIRQICKSANVSEKHNKEYNCNVE